MAQILVRNINKETLESLKAKARANNRSLQAEVKLILEQVAKVNYKKALDISQQFRKKFLGRNFKESVDLIREEREK